MYEGINPKSVGIKDDERSWRYARRTIEEPVTINGEPALLVHAISRVGRVDVPHNRAVVSGAQLEQAMLTMYIKKAVLVNHCRLALG